MVVDGTPGTTMGSNLGSSNLATTITTTLSNDILIAYVGWESGGLSTANSQSSSVTSSTGAPSLTWTLRTRYQNGGAIWWEYLFVAGAAVSSTITNQIWGWSGTTGQTGTYSAVIIDALRDANYVEVNSVTFSVNLAATYKSTAIIQATIPSSAGRVTFSAKGKPIPGCKSRKTSGSNSISCNWKPATHDQIPVYVSYISDGGQQFISAASNVNVSARQTTR